MDITEAATAAASRDVVMRVVALKDGAPLDTVSLGMVR
jgi:hypothetical protein